VVKHHGSGELVIDPIRTIPGLAHLFEAAAIPTRVSDNVRGELWRKLIINCAYNAISALARKPYGQIVPSLGVRDVMRDIVDECLAVATAEGIDVPAAMTELQQIYERRGVNLVRVNDAWAFRTAGDLAFLMSRDTVQQKKLSRAALEVLAIIAYHQPVSRAEIEDMIQDLPAPDFEGFTPNWGHVGDLELVITRLRTVREEMRRP